MDVSQAEYQYISEGFKKLRADFAEKHKPVSAAEDAARSAAIIARNDMMNLPIEQAFIAEEEHAA
jgi:hypothetical protein